MNAQALARVMDADHMVSESWLMEKITGVRSRGADTTASLVGSAVIDDLAALAIRLTDRAPIEASKIAGGAFTLEQAAHKLGVGVRSIQRWRRLGLISMRFQFARVCCVGCAGEAIAWFESQHADMLCKVKHASPTHHARQRLLAQARLVADSGSTLNASAVALARAEKISTAIARRALQQLEKSGSIAPFKRRIVVNDAKAAMAWRSWMRGIDLNTIARRVGQTRTSVLRTIAKQRRQRIHASTPPVIALPTFGRADAAQTLLAPLEVRQQLAHGLWPRQPREFLEKFAPVAQARKNTVNTDAMQLTALRFLLWRAASGARIQWDDLDHRETDLRWAARIYLSLIQRSIGQALGRLQAIAEQPLGSLDQVRICEAIHIALASVCAVLNQSLRAAPGDRPIRLGALAAVHAEKTAVKNWKSRLPPAPGERAELPPSLQSQCLAWLSVAPLRDDLSQLPAPACAGRDLLGLRYGWQGRAPQAMNDAAMKLGIHPRRAAIMAARTLRELVRMNAQ